MDQKEMEILSPLVHEEKCNDFPAVAGSSECESNLIPGTVVVLGEECPVNRRHS